MSTVKITINGTEIETEAGTTILAAAKNMGIDIPTLCNHEAPVPRGACRMCIVEDRGRFKASCTAPVENGMVITTDSARIRRMREMTLQMLFTSRNHYCMYCEMSGDCELQDLGYKMGLDHFIFSTFEDPYPVDLTHPYIIFDHNRCVLCGRCLRACTDLGGHFVLTERSRGVKTMMVADMESPLGTSSCVSCGCCVQVCPTGALIEKRAAYKKNRTQNNRIKTFCGMCALGCGTEIHINTGTNTIVKIHGNWEAGPSHGVLCKKGRFTALYEEPGRIAYARLRQGADTQKITKEETKLLLKDKLADARAYVDGCLSNEELHLIKERFDGRIFALRPSTAPLPGRTHIADISSVDNIVVYGLDLDAEYGALGSLIKNRIASSQTKLLLIGTPDGFWEYLPAKRLPAAELAQACAQLPGDNNMFVYRWLSEDQIRTLTGCPKLKPLWLPPETNTRGLTGLGITQAELQGPNIFLFGRNLPEDIAVPDDAFIACFSPYENALSARADLAVPIPNQYECDGTFLNVEGDSVRWTAAVKQRPGVIDLSELFRELLPRG